MSAWKSVVLGLAFLAAVTTAASADTISWPTNTPFNWTQWAPGQNSGAVGNVTVSPLLMAPAPASAPAQATSAPAASTPYQTSQLAPASPVVNAPIFMGAAPAAAPAPAATPSTLSALSAQTVSSPTVSAPVQTLTASSSKVDAFVNLGTGPYTNAGLITAGNAQAWYNSPSITSLFGGQPNAQQITAFDNTVIQRIEHTFQISGVPISLTTDPTVPAAHTLSLVSNTVSNALPSAIGMTQLGASGFSFIDNIASSAQSVDQLEWIVAHNISHELMLAFGVGENYDKSGNFIDARNANLAMMVDPNASFSQSAAQALLATNLLGNNAWTGFSQGAQVLGSHAVPEPATLLLWAAGLSVGIVYHRKRQTPRS